MLRAPASRKGYEEVQQRKAALNEAYLKEARRSNGFSCPLHSASHKHGPLSAVHQVLLRRIDTATS